MSQPSPSALRKRAIVTAAWLGIGANALLAVAKVGLGFWGNSMALVADGVDTTTDVITSCITLWAAYIMDKPANMGYPYGYARVEAVATKAIAFVVFFVGAEIILSALGQLWQGEEPPLPAPMVVVVAAISIAVKGWLYRYLWRVGEHHHSSMVLANAINMRNDLVLSLMVLVGLGATLLLQIAWIDALLALGIGGWIIKSAFEIFFSTSVELMDGGREQLALYEEIIAAAHSVAGVYNPHRVRARQLSYLYAIELDIEVDGELTVRQGHDLCQQVEAAIRQRIDNVYDIFIHLEPLGNVERDEKYGLDQQRLERARQG